MAKYLLAYHGGSMPETEEDQASVMTAWEAWYGQLGEALVDGGNPVGHVMTIASSGVVSGAGPDPVSGYSIISADTMDEAIAMSKGCPVLGGGGNVEVCETFDVM
jgi:hypothetical protein